MVLDKLSASLKQSIQKISGSLFVDEKLINELVKDIQRALLSADVEVKLVFEIAKGLKERLKNEKTPSGISKNEHLIQILYEEISGLMGGEGRQIDVAYLKQHKPFKIMLVGLFGNGKTTTAGKLAKYLVKRGLRVALLSTDTWRPAAFAQLQQLGKQIGVPVFGNTELKDPVAIYESFTEKFTEFDVIIVDTAGRDALNDELVEEVKKINDAVDANETLLVMNADIGQSAKKQAQVFHDTCGVTGVVITKLDGTAKGGGALTACAVTQAPVLFIGTGEKIDDLEQFKPKNFVGEILGMGDLEKLLEKAKFAIKEDDAKDLSKRLLKGEFTLIDLYDQMEAMNKMGPLSKVMDLIPGMGSVKLPKEALQVQQEKMVVWKYIMNSCTQAELEDPAIISAHRIDRISSGAGTKERDVRDLLKHYKQSKKMMRAMKGVGGGAMEEGGQMNEKQMQRMMKKMGGMQKLMKGAGR